MRKLNQELRDAVAPEELGSKTTSWITRALPGEKYGAAQRDVKMFYPPVRLETMVAHATHKWAWQTWTPSKRIDTAKKMLLAKPDMIFHV